MPRKPKPPVREKTVQVGLRLPRSLVERIDLHAERLRKETGLPGVTRTDAAIALLTKGLEAVEKGGRRRWSPVRARLTKKGSPQPSPEAPHAVVGKGRTF